ncbi:hypothetical protein J7M00_05740 [bacterium]|nr:hypothetical protein [bacterium]
MADPLKDALTIAQNIKKQVDTMIDTGIAQVMATAPELPLPVNLPGPTEVLKTFEGVLPPGLPKLSELMPFAGGATTSAKTEAYVAPVETTPGAVATPAEVIPVEVTPVEAEVVEARIPAPSIPSGESLGEAEELEVSVSTAKPAREKFEIVEA